MENKIKIWQKQVEDIVRKVKANGLKKLTKSQRYRFGMLKGLISGYKQAVKEDTRWLQSILDTKHISEDNRWIIIGRISKLKELFRKPKIAVLTDSEKKEEGK